jgi:hypothetical protein
MPETFVTNRDGVVIFHRKELRTRTLYAIGSACPVAIVFEPDEHSVQSPQRVNRVHAAALERRGAYLATLRNCIHCGINEAGHAWFETWDDQWERENENACDDYVRPAPLACVDIYCSLC